MLPKYLNVSTLL